MKILRALFAMLTADKWLVVTIKDGDDAATLFDSGTLTLGDVNEVAYAMIDLADDQTKEHKAVREVNEILGNK